jgi:hypothetical protein
VTPQGKALELHGGSGRGSESPHSKQENWQRNETLQIVTSLIPCGNTLAVAPCSPCLLALLPGAQPHL